MAGDSLPEDLHESAFRRARRTYRSVVLSSVFYLIWIGVFGVVFGAVGAVITSQDDYRPAALAAITVATGLVGLFAGLLTAFVLIWFAAPRRQRDDARKEADRLNGLVDQLTAVDFDVTLAIEAHPGEVIEVWDRHVTDIHRLSVVVVNQGRTSDFEARIPRTEGLPSGWGPGYHVMQPQWEHTADSVTTIPGGGSGGRRRLMVGVVAMNPREFWFNTVQTGAPQAGLQFMIDALHPGEERVIEFDLEVVNTRHDQVVRKTYRLTIPVSGTPSFEEVA